MQFELNQMEIFYYVASLNSFSAAARELNYSKGFISTQISNLEKNLKTKLLNRTTRHLSLTEEGSVFFAACQKVVEQKQSINSLLVANKLEPQGRLKISAPPSLCATLLAKLLPEFLQQYPKINLILESSAQIQNLVQHDIDIALRLSESVDENYIARLITNFNFVTCATPVYLKQHPRIVKPQDLKQHNCLIYSSNTTNKTWVYKVGDQLKQIVVNANVVATNQEVILTALLNNLGVARLPNYLVMDLIAKKKLQMLLANYKSPDLPLYALYKSDFNIAPKVQAFIQFLKTELKNLCNNIS